MRFFENSSLNKSKRIAGCNSFCVLYASLYSDFLCRVLAFFDLVFELVEKAGENHGKHEIDERKRENHHETDFVCDDEFALDEPLDEKRKQRKECREREYDVQRSRIFANDYRNERRKHHNRTHCRNADIRKVFERTKRKAVCHPFLNRSDDVELCNFAKDDSILENWL